MNCSEPLVDSFCGEFPALFGPNLCAKMTRLPGSLSGEFSVRLSDKSDDALGVNFHKVLDNKALLCASLCGSVVFGRLIGIIAKMGGRYG